MRRLPTATPRTALPAASMRTTGTRAATRNISMASAGTRVPLTLATSGMRRTMPRDGSTETSPQPAPCRFKASIEVSTGWGFPAVFYAFWEPLVAWGVIASLLVVAQARFNRPSPRWAAWAGQAYGAFIVHTPVLVGLSVIVRGWEAPGVLKFAIVGPLAALASFLLARALLRIPGAHRIL